jgi:hypothetical protein
MTEEIKIEKDSGWGRFLRKHWNILAVIIAAGILAFISAVYVFLWFTGNVQSTGLVPSTLGLWTMNNLVSFILHAIFWELLFVGVPAIIATVVGWQWWKKLPLEEKQEYRLFGKSSRSNRVGGAISPLFFIAFAIKVYVDGNWNIAIASWKLDYVVGSLFTILLLIVAITAIPATIGLIWWVNHEMHKKP